MAEGTAVAEHVVVLVENGDSAVHDAKNVHSVVGVLVAVDGRRLHLSSHAATVASISAAVSASTSIIGGLTFPPARPAASIAVLTAETL